MTGIGVISLAGIVVNNAIVLCDFVRQLRERGLSRHDAVVEAGSIRLRPVLLTAVTTVLGLVPLTLGLNIDFFNLSISTGGESSQFWASMGVAVIFGLTVRHRPDPRSRPRHLRQPGQPLRVHRELPQTPQHRNAGTWAEAPSTPPVH